MRTIDGDALKIALDTFATLVGFGGVYDRGQVMECIDAAPTIGGWIKCTPDTMPESGKHVFVTCEIRSLYGYKKQYVCEAFHADTYSVSEGKYPEDTDCYDYCEEDDEYYLKEGWYEVIHNWDEYGSVIIGDFVTHWRAMPEPPKEDATDGNH